MTRVAALALIAGLASLGLPAPAGAQPETKPSATPAETPAEAPVRPSAPVPPPEVQAPSASPDRASQAAPSDERGRYSFHRMGEGFIRLDSHTGHLAQCGWSPTGWSCKTVPDERVALDAEIARLQRENVALKQSLLARGLELPLGVKPEAMAPATRSEVPEAKAPDAASKSQTEAEVDRAIAFVKDVWRRLVEMVVDLQRDIQRKS